jgi:hypothetical protein
MERLDLHRNDERLTATQFGHGAVLTPVIKDLTRQQARAVEQFLIEHYGLSKSGGTLVNKINSIAQRNPMYKDAVNFAKEILTKIDHPSVAAGK